MFKKIISTALALVLAMQIHAGAATPDDDENFSRSPSTVKISLSELSELKAKKEAADKRRFWLIVGGVAVVSLAAGGAAAGLYYYIKLNKVSKDLDAAKHAIDEETKAFDERVTTAVEESEKLKDNLAKIEEERDYLLYDTRKNTCEYNRAINRIDRELLFDIQRYKINKQINVLNIQLHQLCDGKDSLSNEENKKCELLAIDKRKLELELNKFELKTLPESSWSSLDYIEREETFLDQKRVEIENNQGLSDYNDNFIVYTSDDDF